MTLLMIFYFQNKVVDKRRWVFIRFIDKIDFFKIDIKAGLFQKLHIGRLFYF